MNFKSYILAIFLFISFITQAEEIPLVTFTSAYNLSRDDTLLGEMTRTLEKQGEHYHFKSESKTTGIISLFYKDDREEQTKWRMDSEQFIPLEYHYHQQKKNKERKVDIHFDWDNKQIITNVNGSDWKMAAEKNIYDKLLYQIAIMQELRAGREITQFSIADGGKLKTYQFRHLGYESIKTPIGEFEAIKLERYRPNDNRKVIFWCAKKLNYLPIKVENINKKGESIIATIISYSEL